MKLLFILIFLPLIFSFRFNPMSQSIELEENQKASQFLIENDTNESLAIELTVKERIMDENGNETLPATKEMSIFPPQIIIPANEKRTIRVNWSGPSDIKVEKAFRVIAEQLPLKINGKNKKKSGIQMLMRYMAALYVTPKESASKLAAKVIKSTPTGVTIEMNNQGNKHQVMNSPVLTLTHESKKWVIKDKELEGLTGENILAQQKRVFHLKCSQNPDPKSSVAIKIEE